MNILMQELRSYFTNETEQRRALGALGGWFDPADDLDLYDASWCAFDPSSSAVEALRYFQKIYDALSSQSWGAFRSPVKGLRSQCWSTQQTFETIKREFAEFSWRGPVNLLNFPTSGTGLRLESCLTKMKGIKPKKDYPLMVVSKFLHFCNPALVPIYDTKVIWEKVLDCCFKSDFRDFCNHENLPYDRFRKEDTVDFLPAYMRFANSLLSEAHGRFMQVFVEWLAEQPGTELRRRKFDPTTLYARVFEYTAVGAAAAECPQC